MNTDTANIVTMNTSDYIVMRARQIIETMQSDMYSEKCKLDLAAVYALAVLRETGQA